MEMKFTCMPKPGTVNLFTRCWVKFQPFQCPILTVVSQLIRIYKHPILMKQMHKKIR